MNNTELTDIYFLTNEDGDIKIGRTNDFKRRIQELQTASPTKLTLLYHIENVPISMEKHIQDICQIFHIKGEWFEADCITHLRANSWFNNNMITDNLISEYMKTVRPYYESKRKPFSV